MKGYEDYCDGELPHQNSLTAGQGIRYNRITLQAAGLKSHVAVSHWMAEPAEGGFS